MYHNPTKQEGAGGIGNVDVLIPLANTTGDFQALIEELKN